MQKGRFQKFSHEGEALPNDAAKWDVIFDQDTGLYWEAKKDDDSPRNYKSKYMWGGLGLPDTPDVPKQYGDWNELVEYVNTSKLGEFTDWRVPTLNEIRSLRTKKGPNGFWESRQSSKGKIFIDPSLFPFTNLLEYPFYWTTTYYHSGAFGMGFQTGGESGVLIDYDGAHIMLVRSETPEPSIIEKARDTYDWVSKKLRESGYNLTWKFESLSEVDRFFDEQSIKGEAKPDGLLTENRTTILFGLGHFVGEKLIDQCGGRWVADPKAPNSANDLSIIIPGGIQVWPIEKVVKRFRNGSEDSLLVYVKAISGLN